MLSLNKPLNHKNALVLYVVLSACNKLLFVSFVLSLHCSNKYCDDCVEVQVDGKTIKVQIWDTAGQERFMAITKAYYRNALGALVVFDILKASTFQNLDQWYNEVRANAGIDCCIILVGNKSDQRHIRAVLYDDAKSYADARNIQYIETSALDATNVEQAFRTLIADIYRHWAARMDSMKEDTKINQQGTSQIIQPGYRTTQPPQNTNSCCGSY
ncbi:unnamed protein product [Rotaria sp. Silwood1]|nr:unnamed protein product [Rotaria sp. Silwood1]